MLDDTINALADAAGILRNWTDATARPQVVSQDSLRALLAALDLPCDSEAQCRDSHARLAAQQAPAGSAAGLPPLVTTLRDVGAVLPLAATAAGQAFRIEFEAGGGIDGMLACDVDGVVRLPPLDRIGYHRLLLGHSMLTLAVAPQRCYSVSDALLLSAGGSDAAAAAEAARCWGLGVQLYSLRRAGDGGIGDFGALNDLSRRAAAMGAASVAISPVHAMFSGDTGRYSPYGPSSRLFLNALYADPAAVAGPQALEAVLAAAGGEVRARLAALEQDALIDWSKAGALRLQLLRALYERSSTNSNSNSNSNSADSVAFAEFCRAGGEALEDHARFEALYALQLQQGGNGDWRQWPQALRDARSAEVSALAQQHRHEVDFHLFLQWQAARGLSGAQKCARAAGMPVGLIADLAVGADRAGSQAWSRKSQMIHGLSVGAPPDIINNRGQDWGLGAFSPHAMQARGFEAYIEMLRAVFAHCGGVRIDHVLGLARLWMVPDGASSAEGGYLRYPMEDLLRLIALESHRHRAIVIGEDLGTVPAGFDTRIASAGLLGIRVLYFETDGGHFRSPSAWSNQAIATTTTHDLPTVAGWWTGRDLAWRERLDLLAVGETLEAAQAHRADERNAMWQAFHHAGVTNAWLPGHATAADAEAVVDAALGYVALTPAPLALIPIEDALGLVEQPNLPGTVETHPNWRRRLPAVAEALLARPEVQRRFARLNQTRTPLKFS